MTKTIPITFECEICKTMRPDNKIDVFTKPLIIDGKNIGEQYINYCNDNPACKEAAKDFNYFKQDKLEETQTKKSKLKIWIEGYILRLKSKSKLNKGDKHG